MVALLGHYMARQRLPERRHTWRQKVTIVDRESGRPETFYVDFGEYDDGRLAEVWVTSHRMGDSFTRGTMDTVGKTISVGLQSGTSPHEMAHTLLGQNYPPHGKVVAVGSAVTECTSLADYIAQEIVACYGEDGRRRPRAEKSAGRESEGSGV